MKGNHIMTSVPADPSSLIMTLDNACTWRKSLRSENRRLVVTNGCFDILHRGHAEYLYKARCCGDAMLVLINSDKSVQDLKGPTRPIIDEYNRAYMLCSLECVDAVVMFDSQRCTEQFLKLKPDVYVKGGDYNIDNINTEEKAALLSIGVDFEFIPFVEGFSTTDIVNRIQSN